MSVLRVFGQTLLRFIKALKAGQAPVAPPPPISHPRNWPPGLDPSRMPTYLAHPWAELWREEHPRVRLSWLADTAELAVKWATALALAEVLHGQGGTLPDAVIIQIREHMERPTLGRWLGILRALTDAAPKTSLLVGSVFQLYDAELVPRFRNEGPGVSSSNSLLILRNELAHGGGTSRKAAGLLLESHLPGLERVLQAVADITRNVQIIGLESNQARRLTGLEPELCPVPELLRGKPDGPWLLGEAGVLPLLPLAGFGPVRRTGADGLPKSESPEPAAQVYARGERQRLSYTPLGRDIAHSEVLDEDAIREFRHMFRLDERPTKNTTVMPDGFAWDGFLQEAKGEAEDLVGRRTELERAKHWLKSRRPDEAGDARLGWIFGGPGTGKSKLMAQLAKAYAEPTAQRGVFYHRFRAGDARNSRRSFLRLLQSALWNWEPLRAVTQEPAEDSSEGGALEADILQRMQAVAGLPATNPRASAPAFWIFVDGLDEVAEADPQFPTLLRRLTLPGTVWLVAGRAEHGLGEAFAFPGCESVFSNGLPPMSAADIRAMLVEGLGNARYALLKRDDPESDEARNVFVDGVVARSQGLPLYVYLLLEDLRSGQLTVRDEAKLPDGLIAYYDALIARIGLSTVQRDLTLIVCLLARAQEPLDANALAFLLLNDPEEAGAYLRRAEAALRAGRSLLRQAPTRDGVDGWTLYHQSFRDYVGGTSEIPPAPALADVVRDAERLLCRMAGGWKLLPTGNLRNHLFRWGIEYALWWQGEPGVQNAHTRLTDFAYLQARTEALPAAECSDLAGEYASVVSRMPNGPARDRFRIWEAFFREHAHILRRGEEDWPASRILLQLALEHADDSPVSNAAETWCDANQVSGPLLRTVRRPKTTYQSPCLWTSRLVSSEGGGGAEMRAGAISSLGVLVATGYADGRLCLWDASTGDCSREIKQAHGESAISVISIAVDGQLVFSGGADGYGRLWNRRTGAATITVLHGGLVTGVAASQDGNTGITAGDDGMLRYWDLKSGSLVTCQRIHKSAVRALAATPDSSYVVTGDETGTVRLWKQGACDPVYSPVNHDDWVLGLAITPDASVVASVGADGMLQVWEVTAGRHITVKPTPGVELTAVAVSADGATVVCGGSDGKVRFHQAPAYQAFTEQTGHEGAVLSVGVYGDGPRSMSVGEDSFVRCWQPANRTPEAHETPASVLAVCSFEGVAVTGDEGGLVRRWCLSDGGELPGGWHLPSAIKAISAGAGSAYIVAGCQDGSVLRFLAGASDSLRVMGRHQAAVRSVAVSPDGRFAVTGGDDHAVRFWDLDNGSASGVVTGHRGSVSSLILTPNATTIVSASMRSLIAWDTARHRFLAALQAHQGFVKSLAMSPFGTTVASASMDGSACVWDMTSPQPVARLTDHGMAVNAVAWCPTGKLLATAGDDGTVRLWDTSDWRSVAVLKGHVGAVLAVAFFGDGSCVASGGNDGTIRLYSTQGDSNLSVHFLHSGAVTRLVIDGDRLAAITRLGRTAILQAVAAHQPMSLQ